MTGVVFIVCVPSTDYEKHLVKRAAKKRVYIKEKEQIYKPGCYSPKNAKIMSQYLAQARSSDSLANNLIEDEQLKENLQNFPNKENYEYVSMEQLVHDILKTYNIEKTAGSLNIDPNYIQKIFTVEGGEKCEEILDILRDHKIGIKYKSTISIIPCSLYYQGNENAEETFTLGDAEKEKDGSDSAWNRFVTSVRARLTVAQIVEVLKTEAALTFDFMCLLVIAALLCAIGLVENSNVYLLSGVLISPMMGPVMAGTFGSVIRDRNLQKLGVLSEIFGLGTATFVGFVYGAIICTCTDKYGEIDWPTHEMISRGEIRTLGVGCLIALLSGAAVAVGVLSDNIASLVGVAISTSLMPPAVNAGLLWSMATVYYVKGNETTRYVTLSYTEYYSTDRFIELSSLGAVSLCLTFVNIICIYLAGIFVFKIKEVAPMAAKDQARRQFWKHDIKIARDYNTTIQKGEASILKELQEASSKKKNSIKYEHLHHSSDFSREDIHINIKKSQYTWSPCTIVSKKPTIQELQELYTNLMREKIPSPIVPPFTSGGIGHYRKLSQVFNTSNSEYGSTSRTEETLVYVEDHKVETVNEGNKKNKFTVTPCQLDIFKN